MSDFEIRCNECGDIAEHRLYGDLQIRPGSLVVVLYLHCQRCDNREVVSETLASSEFIKQEADEEVREAIAEVLGE